MSTSTQNLEAAPGEETRDELNSLRQNLGETLRFGKDIEAILIGRAKDVGGVWMLTEHEAYILPVRLSAELASQYVYGGGLILVTGIIKGQIYYMKPSHRLYVTAGVEFLYIQVQG